MPGSPVYRAILRRQIRFLRWQRGPRTAHQRRWQSSKGEPRPEDQVPVANTVATLPLWQRLGPLTRLAEAYARAQRSRPYVTQLCSSLAIYLAADISAQHINGKDYDPMRTGRSLTIGAISSIPSYKWSVFSPPPSSP